MEPLPRSHGPPSRSTSVFEGMSNWLKRQRLLPSSRSTGSSQTEWDPLVRRGVPTAELGAPRQASPSECAFRASVRARHECDSQPEWGLAAFRLGEGPKEGARM